MRKRVWNRGISLLMVAVMFVTILAGGGITAAAAEVNSVNLTIPSDLLLGGAIYKALDYDANRVSLDTGTVKSIEWQSPDGALLQENDQLKWGNEYRVRITLDAPTDGTFAANPAVSVNGENVTNIVVSNDSKQLELDWAFWPKADLVQEVTLTGVPEPVSGNTAEQYNEETTEYTATGTWHQYDASTEAYVKMISTDKFKDGGNYWLELLLGAKPGFYFDQSTSLKRTVSNGASEDIPGIVSSDGEEYYASIYYSSGTAITEVKFNVPEPVVGTALKDEALNKVTVPDGSHYTVTGEWQDEADSSDGVFTKGKMYHFEYKVFLHDGYYLGETFYVFVNGAWDISSNGGGKTKDLRYNKSLKTKISEVVLSDVPKAELGKKLQVGSFDLNVPADANYKAIGEWSYYNWDSKSNVPVTDANNTVVSGQKYTLRIDLLADTGCEFAEKYILTVDGASRAESGGYESAASEIEYSFLEQIRQIEVTGVVEPLVGATPDISKLQSADPAKYKIEQCAWTVGGIWDEPVTQFENGGTYYLNVKVEALPGYEIAPNASWKLGTGSGSADSHASESVYLQAEYSFATLIPEIKLSNIPTVKVGENLDIYEIDIPAGANYIVGGDWFVWDDESEDYVSATGAFEEGKTYRLFITVNAHSGYRFSKDATTVYLDGVLTENFNISTNGARGFVYYAAEDAKLIHKVELTIDKPTVGNHYSMLPVVTLPDGVNYHLTGYDSNWHEGSIDENVDFTGYFAEGGSYGADFMLIANKGYVFAEDLLVVVNGIALPKEAYSASSLKTLYGTYFFNMTCEHIYDDALDDTCNVCGYQRTVGYGKSPNTGDQSQNLIWMLLFAVSGMAAVGANRRRRRNR